VDRFSVILTHNRQELLTQVVAAIRPQVDQVIVIDNASDPAARVEEGVWLLQIPDQPPNLARFWNVGIAQATHSGARYVAVLCDDAIVPEGWFAAVTAAMVEHGAAIGCSDPFGYMPAGQTRVKTQPDGAIMERMPGWAWILDATSAVRPDEAFEVWWGDSDVDMQARKAGGMVMVGGHPVPNAMPSGFMLTHPELIRQAGVDGETFAAKYGGWRPW
jgi:glycosyltransferase involved in cell wall biosynthesis